MHLSIYTMQEPVAYNCSTGILVTKEFFGKKAEIDKTSMYSFLWKDRGVVQSWLSFIRKARHVHLKKDQIRRHTKNWSR